MRRATLAFVAGLTGLAGLSSSALAYPGLPATYKSIAVDTPNPIGGGSFGWGIASADLTGAGYDDLLVAQAQTGPGQVFAFDGRTGQLLKTVYGFPYIINPPESNVDGTATSPPSPPTLAFVYVETMPSVGSCPQEAGLPTPKPGVMCPDPTVGPPDGIPSIVVGARNQQVPATDDAQGNDTLAPTASSPHIGRTYILDGLTGAVIQRIDMPVADRTLEANLAANAPVTPPAVASAANAAPQFGRVSSSLQGMPPCAGSNATNNAVGVGPCPPVPMAVQIGDVTGDGNPDIVITARSFNEQVGPATPGLIPGTTGQTGATGTALPGSQCAGVASAAFGKSTCSGGRVYVYDTKGIVGGPPTHINDTPLYTIRNPDAQTQGSTEFGGNVYRVGDVAGGSGNVPDGFPDFVVTSRNADYPLKSPDPTMVDVGAGYLYSGACNPAVTALKCTPGSNTDLPVATLPDPVPEPKAQFSSNFNGGRAVGYLNGSSIPDILLPSALQSTYATADGAAFLFNGDLNAGGGGEASWHFGTLYDPTPHIGGNFSGSFSGVGALTSNNPYDDDVIIGSDSPFDPSTPQTNTNINNLYIMNPQTDTLLQTIPDPDQSPGSGFGVGVVPMGDLTGNGFLSYAASAYLWNGSQAGQGRAYILQADNTPPASPFAQPTPPSNPVPLVIAPPPGGYTKGKCANTITNSKNGATIIAPVEPATVGFKIFGLGRGDVIVGGAGDDCIKATAGNNRLYAGKGNDTILGGKGNDLIFGGPGHDRLFGGGGTNQIYAGTGKTLLVGGPGRDLLVGGAGHDQLFGGPGSDVLIAGSGRSYLDGGKGANVIDARNGKKNVVNCGSERTVALVDRADKVLGCAHVIHSSVARRGAPALVREALERLAKALRIVHGPHPKRPM